MRSFLWFLLIFNVSWCYAQRATFEVFLRDGSVGIHYISDINSLACTEDSFFVTFVNESVQGYLLSDIKRLDFSSLAATYTETEKNKNIISTFLLRQNFPNPFNPSTQIQYELPYSGNVEVTIFDINGRLICSLLRSHQSHGVHFVLWNGRSNSGSSVASGVYFCRVRFDNSFLTKKLLLVK